MFSILIAAASLAGSLAPAVPSAPLPRAPLRSFIIAEDFPGGLARSAARPVTVVLTVGPEGRATDCLITASSGTTVLDVATCRLLRSRPRFVPARDASGAAVSGELTTTVDWPIIVTGPPR